MPPNQPPRYEQIAEYLRKVIANASPGDRLPSDSELCERFDVSRMTARQAVQLVASDHLVVRRRGAGTFVAPRRVPRLLGSPLSFTQSMRRRGMIASSKLIKRGEVRPSLDEASALGLEPTEPAYCLERLRLADGVPMAIERAVMPIALAQRLSDDIDSGSLHRAFENAGHLPTRALAEVTGRRAIKRERDLLQLNSTSDVLLCETRTIWDQDGKPLERTITAYAADRYSFEALLYRGQEEQSR